MKIIGYSFSGCPFLGDNLVLRNTIRPLFGILSCPLLGDCLTITCMVNSIRSRGLSVYSVDQIYLIDRIVLFG